MEAGYKESNVQIVAYRNDLDKRPTRGQIRSIARQLSTMHFIEQRLARCESGEGRGGQSAAGAASCEA